MMKNTLLVLKCPTPYNDLFLEDLSSKTDLEVNYFWEKSARRPWKVKVERKYNYSILDKSFGFYFGLIKKSFGREKDAFILGDWSSISSLLVIWIRIFLKRKIYLKVDSPTENKPRKTYIQIVRNFVLKRTLPRVTKIFACGEVAKKQLVTLGAIEENIVDLQFVVDLDYYANHINDTEYLKKVENWKSSLDIDRDKVIFTICGTIDFEKKAQDLLVKAFSKAYKLSKTPIHLCVAGTGNELEQLKDLASKLGVAKNISFLGWLEPNEVKDLYFLSDALVHSAYYDNFPVAVLEAMAFGLPVIGSEGAGSVVERINHLENGVIYNPFSQEELIECIVKLADNPSQRIAIGQKARKTSESWPVERASETVLNTISN